MNLVNSIRNNRNAIMLTTMLAAGAIGCNSAHNQRSQSVSVGLPVGTQLFYDSVLMRDYKAYNEAIEANKDTDSIAYVYDYDYRIFDALCGIHHKYNDHLYKEAVIRYNEVTGCDMLEDAKSISSNQ